MKIVDYFLIPLAIIAILCASLGLYFGAPDPNEPIPCYKLISADQPGSEFPLLAQGIILAVGAIFVIVVISIGEWNSKNLKDSSSKEKFRHILRCLTFTLIGFCIVVGLSIVVLKNKDLSPSFVDVCKPDPPLSLLCPNVTSKAEVNVLPEANNNETSETSEAGVKVICTTHPIKWIPALSESYLRLITVQTYLWISLFVWMYMGRKELTFPSGPIAIVIGLISTLLLAGICFAAWFNNELILWSIFWEWAIGIALTAINFLVMEVVKLVTERYDRENDHPIPFTMPKEMLKNPDLLDLGALGRPKPIPNPIYPDLSEPADKTKPPSNLFSSSFPPSPRW